MNIMIEKDFHNLTLEQTRLDVDYIVGKVRMENATQEVHFITGQGNVQREVIISLEAYGIRSTLKLGNHGVVVALVE